MVLSNISPGSPSANNATQAAGGSVSQSSAIAGMANKTTQSVNTTNNGSVDWGHHDKEARHENAADGMYGESAQKSARSRGYTGSGGGSGSSGSKPNDSISTPDRTAEVRIPEEIIESGGVNGKAIVIGKSDGKSSSGNQYAGSVTIHGNSDVAANIGIKNQSNESVHPVVEKKSVSVDTVPVGVDVMQNGYTILSKQTDNTYEVVKTVNSGSDYDAYKEKVKEKSIREDIALNTQKTINPNIEKVTMTEILRTDPLVGDSFTYLQTQFFDASGNFEPLPLIGNKTEINNAYEKRFAGYEALEGKTGREEQYLKGTVETALGVVGVTGVGVVGGKTVSTGIKTAIKTIPNPIKTFVKTGVTLEGVGTMSELGGEIPLITERTTGFSNGLKTLSDTLVHSPDPLTKAGGLISAPFLGAAAGVVTGVGAVPSAIAGVGRVATGNANPVEIVKAGVDTASGFASHIKSGFITNPLFTAGEVGVITGAAGKAAKKAGESKDIKLVRSAQGDIEKSFANSLGLDGKATKKGFMAAGDAVKIAEKINVPLKDTKSTGLKELSMFSDISEAEAKAIDVVLAEGKTVSYGTSSNVAYGLNFRKSSDYDASIPGGMAEKTVNRLTEILKPYGGKQDGIKSNADSWQITKPSPGSGIEAHAFDLHKLTSDSEVGRFLNDDAPVKAAAADIALSTSTIERIPTSLKQYNEIVPDGASGKILVEPLSNAYSRKYAATYFPKTDEVANLKETAVIPPKRIEYETKINPEIYTKDPTLPDLETAVVKSIPVKGVAFTRARVKGAKQNLGIKVKNFSRAGTGDISKRINYPLELKDSHRMKDALDLVGITWEYKTHLIRDNVKNPVKRIVYERKMSMSLDRMMKDDVLRTQVKRGAASKLSELTPDFAKFLQQNNLISDRQAKRVEDTLVQRKIELIPGKPLFIQPETKAAFTTGTPKLERLTQEYYPRSAASNNKGSKSIPSPYSPAGRASPGKSSSNKPSPYSPAGRASPGKSSSNKPSSYSPAGRTSPYNDKSNGNGTNPPINGVLNSVITGIPNNKNKWFASGENRKPRKRSDDKRRFEDSLYAAGRRGKIEHLSIVDPAEMMGWGSMTNRKQADVTMYKGKIVLVNHHYSTTKPKSNLLNFKD